MLFLRCIINKDWLVGLFSLFATEVFLLDIIVFSGENIKKEKR